MRGPRLTLRVIGRIAGFALVAAAMVATAVKIRHGAGIAVPTIPPPANPLAAALAHCQAIGVAAQGDGDCEAAWAENRRRFFAGGAPNIQLPSARAR